MSPFWHNRLRVVADSFKVLMAKRKPKTAAERATLILTKARDHETTAKKGLEIGLDSVVITFLFQSFENAVIAAAVVAGMVKAPTHWQRSEQATELAELGLLETNVSDLLDTLNGDRKRVAYDYYEEEDEDVDFNEILETLSNYLQEVEELIKRDGKRIDHV
jgi:hypothetical protein